MTIETFNPTKDAPLITMTPAAIDYVRKQIKKQGKGIGLRLRIKTAGCSGKKYDPEIAEKIEENEIQFPAEELFIFVNKNDYFHYLQGLVIDFEKQGLNAVFKYLNPNKKGACGCGESFIT